MNKEYTNSKVMEIINKYSEQYPDISFAIIEGKDVAETLWNQMITDIRFDKARKRALMDKNMTNLVKYFKGLQEICKNNCATFLILDLFQNLPMIIINPTSFNAWQDLYSDREELDYTDENFIEAVDLTIQHELGHYLDWKERGKIIFEEAYYPECPNNRVFIDTEILVEDYFNNKIEDNANKIIGLDVKKFIHYTKILNRVTINIMLDCAWNEIKLSDENWNRIKEFCGDDRSKLVLFANNIFKVVNSKKAKKKKDTEIVNYIINNFDKISDLELNMLYTIKI